MTNDVNQINTTPGSAVTASGGRFSRARLALSQPMIVWLLVLAFIPLSRMFSANFPSWALVTNTLTLSTFLVLVAFGQGLVILSGGIDLSVPSTIAIAAFFTGYLTGEGIPAGLAAVAAVLVASLCGLASGLIVARTTFPPFIVTLAVSTIAAALLLGFSAGSPGQTAPNYLIALFSNGEILGLRPAAYLFVMAALLGLWVQYRTRLGRRTYAIGNSIVAARISGIKVASTQVLVYWVASLFYAIAGVLLMGYGSGSDLNIGSTWLLPSIAAVVIGGSSIAGGSGRFGGTIGAAVLLTIVSIDISAIGWSEGLKQILYGLVIVIALLLNRLGSRTS